MTTDFIVPYEAANWADSFTRTTDPINITTQPMPIGGLAWGAGPIGGVGSGSIHCTGGVARTAGAGSSVMIAFSAPAAQDVFYYTEWLTLTGVQSVGPAFAIQNANNFYYVRAVTGGWRIWRYNSTTSTDAEATQVVQANVAPASGDKLVIEKIGDRVNVTINGTLSLTATIAADMVSRDRFGFVLTGLDSSSVTETAAYLHYV